MSVVAWRGGLVATAFAWLCLALPAAAQSPSFPALSGRVVDEAGLLKPQERDAIAAKLKAHEDKTTDQVVVATIASLRGTPAEDYANGLFRAWKLGQAGKNNGVLLLVAPNDRKVRIEVGYGLEGALTDALSKVIVSTAIAPKFKSGDFAAGIDAGVDAILSILAGDAAEWQRRPEVRDDETSTIDPMMVVLIVVIVLFLLLRAFRGGGGPGRSHRMGNGSWVVLPTPAPSGGWGGGFGGASSGGGGGFSGGGGSSGGGGASGDW